MGCIQSKLFYCVQNEKEDEGAFESDAESKLDVVDETESKSPIGVTKQSAVTDHGRLSILFDLLKFKVGFEYNLIE